jgi:WD40 repeat protein
VSQTIQTPGHSPKFRAPVVTGVALNHDASSIAVVGDDHYVQVLNVATGRFTEELKTHTDWVRVARFSPDGRWLVTAGNDRRAFLWDVNDWTHPIEFCQQSNALIHAAFSPDSRHVSLVGFGDELFTYSTETVEEINRLSCPCDDMRTVAYSPDGSLLAAAGRSGSIRVWETASGNAVTDLPVHRQRIRSIEFRGDRSIVSCSEDQFVRITNIESGKPVAELPRFGAKLFAVKLIDDSLLATAGSDNQISIWDLNTSTKRDSLTGHTGTVSCLAGSQRVLVSGSYDTQVRIWRRAEDAGMLGRQTRGEDGWNLKLK